MRCLRLIELHAQASGAVREHLKALTTMRGIDGLYTCSSTRQGCIEAAARLIKVCLLVCLFVCLCVCVCVCVSLTPSTMSRAFGAAVSLQPRAAPWLAAVDNRGHSCCKRSLEHNCNNSARGNCPCRSEGINKQQHHQHQHHHHHHHHDDGCWRRQCRCAWHGPAC